MRTKFAERLRADSGILQLMNDLGEALCDNDVQMLGGGNPANIAEAETIFRDAMQRMLADGRDFEEMLGNYDAPQGNLAFIDSLAELLSAQLNADIHRDNIAITNGSQAGFGVLFNLFAGRCDGGRRKKILLPLTPEYIGYADVGLDEKPLFAANAPTIETLGDFFFKYRIDLDRLHIGDDIGALCISRPTNPTGNVVTDDEIETLRARARAAGLPLIIDGAYGLPFPAIVFADATPRWDEGVVLCLSLSKLGMPGARTGIIVAAPDIIEKISGANAIFNLAPGRFGPALANRLIADGKLLPLCKNIIAPFYRQRSTRTIELLRDALDGLPVRVHKSEGAIFLWLWFAQLPITCEQLYQRLKQRGVLVVAGQHFFPGFTRNLRHRDECIRITFAADQTQVERGIAIIGEEARRAYQHG